MSIFFDARRAWPLSPAWLAGLCILLLATVFPATASALRIERGQGPRAESLRLDFTSGQAAGSAARTGAREISVSLPEGIWQTEARPEPVRFESGLIRTVRPTDRGLVIELSTDAFGSIALPAQGRRLELTVFADPLGARWRPPGAGKPAEPAKPATQAAPRPKKTDTPKTAAKATAPAPTKATKTAPAKAPATDTAKKAAPATKTTTPTPTQGAARKAESPPPQAKPAETPPARAAEEAPAPAATNAPDAAHDQGTPTAAAKEPTPATPSPEARFSGTSAMRAPIDSLGPAQAPAYSAPEAAPAARKSAPPPPAPAPRATVAQETPLPQAASELPATPAPVASPATAPAGAPAETGAAQPGPAVAADGTPAQTGPSGQAVRGRLTSKTLDELLAEARKAAEAGTEQMEKERAAADLAVEEARAAKANEPVNVVGAEPAAPPKPEIAPGLEEERRAKQTADLPREGLEPTQDQAEAELQKKMQEALQVGMVLFANRQYSQAIATLQPLIDDAGTPEPIREAALYTVADAQFQLHRDELPTHHQAVVAAFDRAINFNPKSQRIPSALLSLGLVHLKVGNAPEARGYFNLLRDKYPGDPNLPYIDFYWGQYHYDRGEYQKAADEFQHLLQAHPEADIAREASVGLARSLESLGYYDQAWKIVDYIRKRWPRYYLDAPGFLELSGNVALHLDKLDIAREDYWTYYNLEPKAPGMDLVLARLGDIYLRQGKPQTARQVYETVAERFPDDQGGLVAQMRLAEEGIHDDPTSGEMFPVFDRPFNLKPVEIYTRIIERYPKSGLAPLARLKLAMWNLWQKKYDDALAQVASFFKDYGQSPLAGSALKTGLAAFEQAAEVMGEEGNYGRVVDLWQRYPFLADNMDQLDPDARMALSLSYWKEGQALKALALAKPFLEKIGDDKLSQMAVNLALSIYLDQNAWGEIVALADNPGVAALPERQRRDLTYAHALALVSLGDMAASKPLWTKLAAIPELDPGQRAYALFYLARFAGEEDNLQNEYLYAQEALGLFLQAEDKDREKIKDTLTMLMDVTQRAGRLEDALRWAEELGKLIPEDDPGWPAYRFRLAGICKAMNDLPAWQKTLGDLIAKKPACLEARLAQTALDGHEIENQARPYTQGQ